MTQLNLDDDLYQEVKRYVENDKIEYPSIINFVEKSVRDRLRIETINRKEQE